MGLFDSESRRLKREARNEHRSAIVNQLEGKLLEAIEAANQGDVLAEETAILEAGIIARNARTLAWNPSTRLETRHRYLVREGQLRRTEALGFAGETILFEDRIICLDEITEDDPSAGIHVMTSSTQANVMTEGEIRTSSRPTLTRMAIGSILPGTALVPGLALQKKKETDDRRLFFTIEQSAWGKIIELDVQQVDVLEMRQLAMKVNVAAGQLAPTDEPPHMAPTADRLRELAALHKDGLITDAEYQNKRKDLVDRL